MFEHFDHTLTHWDVLFDVESLIVEDIIFDDGFSPKWQFLWNAIQNAKKNLPNFIKLQEKMASDNADNMLNQILKTL